MANGNNKKFLSDPIRFLTENVYYDSDFCGDNSTGNGVYNIDFVMKDVLYMKKYDNREHRYGAVPVHAYYLSAKANEISKMDIGGEANYLFTPMLSGCTFAVYGNDRKNLSAVHINDLDEKGLCKQAINGILAENYNFFRIVCVTSDTAEINNPNVQTYNWNEQICEPTLVFGMRDPEGDWHFYKKDFMPGNPLTEM